MIRVNAAQGLSRHVLGAMLLQAYELYLQHLDGRRGVEVIACQNTEEAMQRARELLDERDLDSVEVHLGGDYLFSVGR